MLVWQTKRTYTATTEPDNHVVNKVPLALLSVSQFISHEYRAVVVTVSHEVGRECKWQAGKNIHKRVRISAEYNMEGQYL